MAVVTLLPELIRLLLCPLLLLALNQLLLQSTVLLLLTTERPQARKLLILNHM